MEKPVPEASSATVSTERGPGGTVDTAALSVERRFRQRRARLITASSIRELLSTRLSLSESRASASSAVARVEGLAWNTVARWLEKAAYVCRGFNQRRTAGFGVEELQADEIRSFAGSKARLTWIFVAIEVWSRLWPSTLTGRRSYRNTLALLRDVANRMDWERLPLIVTDGFDFYVKVVRRGFGPAALCTARYSRREETIVS